MSYEYNLDVTRLKMIDQFVEDVQSHRENNI